MIDSRKPKAENSLRRRRRCKDCEGRFTTREVVEDSPLHKRGQSKTMQLLNGADLEAIRKIKEISDIINGGQLRIKGGE